MPGLRILGIVLAGVGGVAAIFPRLVWLAHRGPALAAIWLWHSSKSVPARRQFGGSAW